MAPPLALRSPREVTLSRLASILGHSSVQPVRDLLMMLAEIDPTKIMQFMDRRPEVCADNCSFPSLDLFATLSAGKDSDSDEASNKNPATKQEQQKQKQPDVVNVNVNIKQEEKGDGDDNDVRKDVLAAKDDGEEENDASSGIQIAVDTQKKTCPDDKGEDDVGSSTETAAHTTQQGKQKQPSQQEDKANEGGNDHQEKSETVPEDAATDKDLQKSETIPEDAATDKDLQKSETVPEDAATDKDLQHSAASNLSQPLVLSRDNVHEASAMMLRSLGLSFSSLIDSRVRAWVYGMLGKSLSSNDIDGRQALMSLLSVSDAINLTKATTSFQALPSVLVPSKKKPDATTTTQGDKAGTEGEIVAEKEEHLLLPLMFQAVVDIDMDGEQMSVLIQSPGTIIGTILLSVLYDLGIVALLLIFIPLCCLLTTVCLLCGCCDNNVIILRTIKRHFQRGIRFTRKNRG